jgi:triosephosphate isomerase (TIM)
LSPVLTRNGNANSIIAIVTRLNDADLDPRTEVAIIVPPSLYLFLARQLAGPGIAISAQNVFDRPNSPFTSELSVGQLADAKIDWAIIGHSEDD